MNKLYTRNPPTKFDKIIYIFAEGVKREKQYFKFFAKIDSRIDIVVHELEQEDNNSPTGLFEAAQLKFKSIELAENDEVWFVIDTDAWFEKIEELREKCEPLNWKIAQSNPCFEVWLYFHFFEMPSEAWIHDCKAWKNFQNENISGGFDPRKHPIHIETAIYNAENQFTNIQNVGNTEVYQLGKAIYEILKTKIDRIRHQQ